MGRGHAMAGERASRRTLGTTPSNRRRLSNITNIVNGSWSNENELVKSWNKSNEVQLRQVISVNNLSRQEDIRKCRGIGRHCHHDQIVESHMNVHTMARHLEVVELQLLSERLLQFDNVVAILSFRVFLEQDIRRLEQTVVEKDQEIETQRLFMQKLQKEYYTSMCKRSQQNEDIIGYNSRLSKELSSVREQLKLLHHEHTQMTAVYKISEIELQAKLAEVTDQLKQALEEKNAKASYNMALNGGLPTTVSRRPRSVRRHSVTGGGLEPDIWNPSTNTNSLSNIDSGGITTRAGSRQRSSGTSCKESSLKTKIRQQDCASLNTVVACSGKRYNNRYGHLNGLETMQEVPEETETQAPSVTSCRSRVLSSSESMSSDLTGGDQPNQSSHSRRVVEATSTSESNPAAVRARSTERTRPCEKNPPVTPQRKTASQPTTPRKKSEAQIITPQRKTTSQPGISRPPSPLRQLELHQSTRVSSSKPRPASPYSQREVDQPSRASLGGRPSRRAAETVVSYKEPSLIAKMRRPH